MSLRRCPLKLVMEDDSFKPASLPVYPELSETHFQVRLTADSFSAMKSSLTGSRLAVTTSVEAAWMNSVQGRTQLPNSKCKRPIILQSTAKPVGESPISATHQ